MVLIDTSVWIQHFRHGEPELARLLGQGTVLLHPFVLGELACGNFRNRAAVLENLRALRTCQAATAEEVLWLIEDRRLWGGGIGLVDAHLLAAALLANCSLWTIDERLHRAASDAGARVFRPAAF